MISAYIYQNLQLFNLNSRPRCAAPSTNKKGHPESSIKVRISLQPFYQIGCFCGHNYKRARIHNRVLFPFKPLAKQIGLHKSCSWYNTMYVLCGMYIPRYYSQKSGFTEGE